LGTEHEKFSRIQNEAPSRKGAGYLKDHTNAEEQEYGFRS